LQQTVVCRLAVRRYAPKQSAVYTVHRLYINVQPAFIRGGYSVCIIIILRCMAYRPRHD